MTKFETAVDELTALLEEENAALEAGEIDKLEPLFDRKSEIYNRLEIYEPVVEPILESHIDDFPQMRTKLPELRELVDANGILIERITAATSAVAREVKRIRNRHSLDGMYEKTGRKLGDPTSGRRSFDEKL
ncbi:hypothetical protein Salmuc_03345 [Salipiger mucosus DSM 16094]|uniref:Flagellar biosynthesis protein FlgN n=2 Tax=Salipiger mucosus TaxID=263378 RepID=S9QEN4_9RHOB|nr:hypothetical protein Salmuc_03345 [Salipiger mucosus DSM 16094]